MIWRLIYELEYWIQIGIGSDIVASRANRPEYQHYVNEFLLEGEKPEKIPARVLIALKKEAETVPFYKSRTFWRLVWINFKKIFKK